MYLKVSGRRESYLISASRKVKIPTHCFYTDDLDGLL